uniref:B30.2/SPRY domain-containing protein n=1 Tax=Neogobius melanostomus TaxID=47308 RepID=A0A8C6SDE6_9GOBI
MVTEVRGFSDEQKEQYFRNRFRDEQQATAVISHIKSIRSLYIMCYIPVFCWILSVIIQKLLEQTEKPKLPKTLTEMYVHFLVVQAKVKNIKYHEGTGADFHWTPETREMVRSLGKLAFEQLQKGNLIFYESDLSECGLDAEEIARYSGVFTQVFREEPGLYQDKVYCFIHLTVQEFLAALHVHQTFFSSGENLLSPYHQSVRDFYNSSVRESLYCSNGQLDLFMRFLLGLSLPTNQSLLQGLVTQTGGDIINCLNVQYIKKKINKKCLSEENRLNLLHCLNELNDHSLEEQIQLSIKKGHINPSISPAQWSALCFLLLSTDREVFDLKKYHASEEVLLKLLPVVQASKKALLSDCNLTEHSCAALSSLLSSESCTLKVLDLSNNPILDSGVEQLCEGLKSATCTLEILSLSCCNLTEHSCGLLSSVLTRSCLKHLDLSNNHLQNSGLDLLCAGLKSAPCRLQSLRVSRCLVSEEGVAALVSALSSSSSLKELDLTNNNLSLCTQLTTLQGLVHTLRVEPTEVEWLSRPSLTKYYCNLSLDPNSAHKALSVYEDRRRVSHNALKYLWFGDDQPDRFEHFTQVLCASPLTGRCYWEVEWSGSVDIVISYRKIRRKGEAEEQEFGANDNSWCLRINSEGYTVRHNKMQTLLPSSWFGQMTHSLFLSGRVGVFLDCEAGSLSFFKCSSGQFTHLYTFRSTFMEPLYAGFGLCWHLNGSSVSLVNVRREEQY